MFESSKYQEIRADHAKVIAQTLDTPVMILDYWELTDVYAALVILFICGLILAQWTLTLVLFVLVMGLIPSVRRKNEKGFFFHWPYKNLGVPLRGLPNPLKKTRYSD